VRFQNFEERDVVDADGLDGDSLDAAQAQPVGSRQQVRGKDFKQPETGLGEIFQTAT
jgi:hypothetical protein